MKFSFIAIISILFILARAFGPQTPSAHPSPGWVAPAAPFAE